jgi:lipoyl(octanoyl) transferase
MEWKISDRPVNYPEATGIMEQRVSDILAGREGELVWFLEHPALYTGGTSAKEGDLHDKARFPHYKTGRGGQWTYHGPGQRIGYVMLDLKQRGAMDVRAYVQNLEQWIIATLAHFGIKGEVREGRIGVWTIDKQGKEAKIAALGIRVRKWVTFHGIAINVAPDLAHYQGIVPCGINEFGVTSLKALGVDASMDEVDRVLKQQFARTFKEV